MTIALAAIGGVLAAPFIFMLLRWLGGIAWMAYFLIGNMSRVVIGLAWMYVGAALRLPPTLPFRRERY